MSNRLKSRFTKTLRTSSARECGISLTVVFFFIPIPFYGGMEKEVSFKFQPGQLIPGTIGHRSKSDNPDFVLSLRVSEVRYLMGERLIQLEMNTIVEPMNWISSTASSHESIGRGRNCGFHFRIRLSSCRCRLFLITSHTCLPCILELQVELHLRKSCEKPGLASSFAGGGPRMCKKKVAV